MYKPIWINFLLILSIIACNENQDKIDQIVPGEKTITVKTDVIRKENIRRHLRLTGEASAFSEVEIFPKINGLVLSTHVKLGDKVKKNQLMAEVRQDIPGMEFSVFEIESTCDGVITSEHIRVGASVSVQRAAYVVSRFTPMTVTGQVPESYYTKIKPGQKAVIRFDAVPQIDFTGKVIELSPFINAASRSAKVKIELLQSSGLVKPGMFAHIKFITDEQPALTAPVDAVMHEGVRRHVFVIKNGIAKKRLIKTGILTGQRISIQADISEGDSVVVLGQNLLEDGSKVKVREIL